MIAAADLCLHRVSYLIADVGQHTGQAATDLSLDAPGVSTKQGCRCPLT